MARVYAEPTPNPLAMKFNCDRAVQGTGSRTYKTKEEAAADPLAKKLFEFPDVTNVFILGNFVTVSVADPSKWPDLEGSMTQIISQNV